MKRTLLFALLIAAIAALTTVGCSDDEKLLDYNERDGNNQTAPGNTDDDPDGGDYDGIARYKQFEIEVDEEQPLDLTSIPIAGDTYTFNLLANDSVEWTASIDASWGTLTPSAGSGNGTFIFTAPRNNGTERYATITIATDHLLVKENTIVIPVVQYGDVIVTDRNIHSPRVVSHNGTYYVFSSNLDLPGAVNTGGVMMWTTTDMVSFSFAGYIADEVSAAARNSYAATYSANADNVRMATPYVAQVNGEWRLYYTVHTGYGSAAMIGYATSASIDPDFQNWTDHGIILATPAGEAIRAYSPQFFNDGGIHYLIYGEGGVNITQLDPASQPTGTTVTLTDDMAAGDPYILKNNGEYYLFTALWKGPDGSNYRASKSTSGSITGPYGNHRVAVEPGALDNWMFESGYIVPSLMPNNNTYYDYRNQGGLSFVEFNGALMAVHHAQAGVDATSTDSDGVYRIIVRQTGWMSSPQWPTASLDPYTGYTYSPSRADMVGTWYYTTLWYWNDWAGTTGLYNHKPDIRMVLNNDGSLTGDIQGTWTFDQATGELHFISDTWGGENIRGTVFAAANPGNFDGTGFDPRFSVLGNNCTYAGHPGIIMRKTSNASDN